MGPVCLLAGGLGTRLGSIVKDTPKPLLPVAGRPFLDWQLELLARYGVTRVVLCVGYLGDRIEAEIGPSRHGIEIVYAYDPPDLAGTAGAIRDALPLLGDTFLVLYGDTYLRIDYADVWRTFVDSGQPALMTVLENGGQWDTSNVLWDATAGAILGYEKHAPTPDMLWIDYGLGCLSAQALLDDPDDDLAGIYTRLARAGRLAGYLATERFYEIGTPAALAETEEFLLDRR